MKAIKRYFPAVVFITLFKVFLTFEFVDETLKCGPSFTRKAIFLSYYLLCLRYARRSTLIALEARLTNLSCLGS